ncbi:MAG TPA: hypothetical protein PKA82_13665 [Pyrinomonadaceae bacterium]|nr:hypothetical protein [Pyrinomonadaceae bacterium]
MKVCPKCNVEYADDTLSFCLNDGTPLTVSTTGAATAVFNESETVVRGSQQAADWPQSQATHYIPQQSTAPPPSQGSTGGKKGMIVLALAALGLLVVVGIAAVAGFIYFNSSGNNAAVTNVNSSPTPTRTPETNKPSPTTTPSPSPTATLPNVTPTPGSTPGSTSIDNKPPTNFTTKRFSFPSGSYSSNINDALDEGEQRTYLVACRAGQTMNTSVVRGLPCVTYSNGGSSLRWTTFSGDNKVTIKNNCNGRSAFTVSVSVI